MTSRQFYLDPERAAHPMALPDGEVWWQEPGALAEGANEPLESGWYWWACQPGCIPDSDPIGPFGSEAEAIADAQGV